MATTYASKTVSAAIKKMPPLPMLNTPPHREFTGVVVSVGKMDKAVKVRIAKQEWNKHIRKFFPAPYNVIVSDPTSSLREGDVINLRNGHRASRQIHHVVTAIVAPFGPGISERPPLLTEEQRAELYAKARMAKDRKQAERGRWPAIQRLRAMETPTLSELSAKGEIAESETEVPEGGPPGGEAEVGPINERARHNVEQAEKFTEKALENEKQREEVVEKVAGEGKHAESVAKGEKTAESAAKGEPSTTTPEKSEKSEKSGGFWKSWF